MAFRRVVPVLLSAVLVSAVALVACGGSSTTEKATVTPECSGSAGALGPGQLCVDAGFRIDKNNFAFPNWVGVEGDTDKPDASLMVRLFGTDAVCTSGSSESDCELNPAAQATLDQWTEALDGGHCEGMATLSMRYYLGLQKPADTEAGATSAVSIKRPETSIDREINLWWATQFMPEVRTAAATSRQKTPTELVSELITGLKNGDGYTLGIYADGYGHAVTPFAVTKDANTYSVHIYDNNFPGEKKIITVDSTTNQWKYTDGTENLDGTPYVWKGGTGTFELTPMSVRNGPFTEEFGAVTGGTEGTTVVEMSAKGGIKGSVRQPAAGLLVTTTSGKRVGIANGALVNEIPGATYTIGKGGLGTSLIMVEVPSGEEFTVDPQPARASDDTTDRSITLAVTTPDGSRTELRSTRRLLNNAPPSREFTVNAQREVTVRPTKNAEVSVTNNKGRLKLEIPANGALTTKRGEGPNSNLSVTGTDEKGKEVIKKSLPVARARAAVTPGQPSATIRSMAPTSIVDRTSIPSTSVLRTTTTVQRTSTTVARSSTSTTVVRSSSTSSTVVRSSTTSSVARSSTTTTVARSSSTSSTAPPPSSSSSVPRSSSTTIQP